jgi:hypothetical protein
MIAARVGLIPLRSNFVQFDRLRRMDGRDGMLVDDLGAIASHKLDGEVVERSDLALESDSIHEKHCHLNSVVAKMLEEGILEG